MNIKTAPASKETETVQWYFVDKIATKLYAFEENSKISIEYIPYTEYLENERDFKELENFVSNSEKNSHSSKEKSSKKLSYKENEILQKYPAKIEKLEQEILELNHSLSKPELYQEKGINALYERLKEAQKELEILEQMYFSVLEKSI